jgi:Galactose-3-O-sulfotransferase
MEATVLEIAGNRQGTAAGPTLIFLHIGKTAGTSLRQVLRRNYRPAEALRVGTPERPREETLDQFATLPEHTRESARLLFGHMVYGLHTAVPRDSTYITMVRKPKSLVLSQYRFVLRRTGHRLHERVVSENMGIEEYIRSGISLEMDNSQTRAIAGDLSTPYGECTDAMLDTAKANIERDFAVVGLTERFDETLVLLQKTFGWSKLHYVRANVAPHSPIELSDEANALIKEHNRLDDELYRFASERFDAAIATYPSFAEDLARFNKSNALYKPWGTLTHVFPRRVAASVGLKRRAPRASAATR